MLQADDASFRPAQHRAGHVQGGGGRRPTGDHERIGQWNPTLEVRDLALDAAREVWRHHHEVLLQLVVLGGIGRQFGADGEQLALDPEDDRVPAPVPDQGAGDAERRDRLIDRAVRLGAWIGLGDASAIEESGLSPISGLGDDALSRDGNPYAAPRASTSCVQCCSTLRWLENASGGNASGRNHPTC